MHSNPDVGKPATVQPLPVSAAITPATRIAGADLLPNIPKLRAAGGVAREFFYWVGVTPTCPVEHIDCAGINFPKLNEDLIDDPMRGPQRKRVPVIGAIVKLNEDKIRRMRERLPRTVLRFLSNPGQKDEPGTGQNIGDLHQRPSRGQLITIPTAEDIEWRKKSGKPTRVYTPHPADVPAARFMFAVLCTNQEKGNRGDVYPETLETAGLVWPDPIDAELSDLMN